VAKGQLRSNREKKKPKAEKNKKKSAPVPLAFERTDDWERGFRQKVLVTQSASTPGEKSAATSSLVYMSSWNARARDSRVDS
jgi:hypothetical protein